VATENIQNYDKANNSVYYNNNEHCVICMSPILVGTVKSRRFQYTEHLAKTKETKNDHNIFTGIMISVKSNPLK